jgi:hypothetical protein
MKEAPVTGPLWDVARTLRARVRTFFEPPPGAGAPPLELLQAALDELEGKVQPSGRGTRRFPYSRVIVHVTRPAADHAAIEAVFGQLEARLRERLAELRCDIPPSLAASVSVTDATNGARPALWVEGRNDQDADPRTQVAAALPELRVIVVKGQCDRPDYQFRGGAIAIGRGTEPADAFGRVRRNDVAFLDGRDGVTETVGRAHARIEFDPALRAYLLFNESSSNPTFLLRGGRSMRVTPRDRRGVRVQSGDEVQLGRAMIRVAVAETDSSS